MGLSSSLLDGAGISPEIGSSADPVWLPTSEYLGRSRLRRFLEASRCASTAELDERARRDPAWFWAAAFDALGLAWDGEPTAVFADGGGDPEATRWFVNGRFNLARNAIDRWVDEGRGDEAALLWETEAGGRGIMSFAELSAEVRRVSRGLRRHGIGSGDVVGIQLPLVPEAAVALLACARIGAVSVPLFSGFAPDAVADRLRRAGAKAFVYVSGYYRRGRLIDRRADREALSGALEGVDVWIGVPVAADVPVRAGDVPWAQLEGEAPDEAEVLGTEHPLLVAYTSGTTGAPKGAILTHAGFALKAGLDAAWLFDLDADDRALWITDPGWIMAPIVILGGLIAGAAVVLYDGAHDWPDAGRLWRVVRGNGVTMLGVSPTLVRSLIAAGKEAAPIDAGSLRILASSGEPWTSEAFDWLFHRVGSGRLPIINYSGGTEVSGAILSNTTIDPLCRGGFSSAAPGMAAEVFAENGESVRDAIGELVLLAPSPGMARAFWGEPGRLTSTYYSRWPGVWTHGDLVLRHKDGTWFILGRSDDTLKIAGKRIGPVEVEEIVNEHDDVAESVAIGVPDPIAGAALTVFVRCVAPEREGEALRRELARSIEHRLGRPFRPRAVRFIDALPKTMSGKILRRLVRSAHVGDEAIGDLSSLDQPSALDGIRGAR